MPKISAQQALALQKGVLYKNAGGTSTQVFAGVSQESLFTPGVDTLFVNASVNTANENVTLTGSGSQVTTGILPGMAIKEVGTKAANIPANAVVYSVTNSTTFKMGTAPQYVIRGLSATLTTSPANNTVTLTNGNTSQLVPGYRLTKVSGSGDGVFGNSGVVYVQTILNNTQFTVASDVPNLATAANHATAGTIVFDVGGYVLNATTSGQLDIRVGGVDFANDRFPGLGDLGLVTYSLADSDDTVTLNAATVLVYLNGGSIDNDADLEVTERDYHTTGIRLFKKLK